MDFQRMRDERGDIQEATLPIDSFHLAREGADRHDLQSA
jgi:hypothetical protein